MSTNNTPLSPAAQAVLYAMRRSYDHEPTRRALAAAVLRVAIAEVLPFVETWEFRAGGMRPGGTGALTMEEARQIERNVIRRRMDFIATELDPQSRWISPDEWPEDEWL